MNVHEKFRLLADREVKRILAATFLSAKTPEEICEKCGISVASCRRKIKLLHEAGLLTVAKEIVLREGRNLPLYQAVLRDGRLLIEKGKTVLRFKLVGGDLADEDAWRTIEIV